MPVAYSNPPGLRAPASRYAHAAPVTGPGRRLAISGQVGFTPDGQVPAEAEAQLHQCLRNLAAVLDAPAMSPRHVDKLTCFLPDAALIAPRQDIRGAFSRWPPALAGGGGGGGF